MHYYPDWVARDTTPEAARVQFAVLQQLGMDGRARLGFELSDAVRGILIDGIRHQFPGASESFVRHEVLRRVLPPELFRSVLAHLEGRTQ